MKKSLSKRIKISKHGKLLRRKMAVDHCRTRKSTKNLKHKLKMVGLDYPRKKLLNY